MKIFTNSEAATWCNDRGFQCHAADAPHWRDPRINNCLQFVTRDKNHVAEAFIRGLIGSAEFDEAIVWLTDWPLYRPDEMAVIRRFRASIGEARDLIDAPAHVFDRQEADDCIGLFNLCIHYYFDAFMFVTNSNLIAYNSHDEVQYVSSLSNDEQQKIKTVVENYNLELLPLQRS